MDNMTGAEKAKEIRNSIIDHLPVFLPYTESTDRTFAGIVVYWNIPIFPVC